jgi:NCS2 family nucleobase:cation symporter-2/xanthine permease XanP
MAVQTISHREDRQIDYQVIQGTMYGDALGNVITGALGTAPNETYAENIAAMKVTGATCRTIGVCGAILLILLPFSPKISMAAVQLPTPIFGGFLMGLAAMMFPAGLELVFRHGITHRSGLLVGISLCIGLIAESGYFFPNIFPISINVFLKSGVAAGGLAAVLLSILFRLTEMKGYTAHIPAGLSNLHLLARRVEEAGEELDISPERIMKLQLACEEIFVHIAPGENFKGEKRSLVLRISEHESDIRVEIIFGENLDDLKNVEIPDNLMHADPSDLDQLGLALFHTLVVDFHQALISGRTYIWFKLA